MWYVMQVRTGTEENIRCQCQRLISSNVLERCFIPYYQQKKRFQGEWHIQERILFPGYVFLIAQNLECLVNGLKKVIGLTKLIGIGDQIVPLVQEEVELLMRIGTDKQLVEMSSGIIENDRVRILSGPLIFPSCTPDFVISLLYLITREMHSAGCIIQDKKTPSRLRTG